MSASHELRLKIEIIGAKEEIREFARPGPESCEVVYRNWELEKEIEEFQRLDVGVYPLVEDEWTKGKCGFKAIQYMAAGVPCIASPVGTNLEVIEHERNGLFAQSPKEWEVGIVRLLTDQPFRDRIIAEGYRTVRERYSLAKHGPRLAEAIRGVCEQWERGRRGGTGTYEA